MTKLVVDKSQIECTLGAAPSQILVTSQTFIKIAGSLVATENDIQPISNIQAFGNCKCNPYNPPCVPSPQKWNYTTVKDTINGMKKLTEDSFCMCAKGGKISFTDTGENTYITGE